MEAYCLTVAFDTESRSSPIGGIASTATGMLRGSVRTAVATASPNS